MIETWAGVEGFLGQIRDLLKGASSGRSKYGR